IAQKKLPGWQLDIFGGGDKKQFTDIIEKENIEAVTFHNPTSEIGKEYADSSFYVMSSRYEGLPLVLLEAMSYGLPVVSFQCPCGPADIIKEQFGILVPPENTEALAEAIVRCADNQSWRESASRNARSEARKYSKDEIMKRWQYLFQSFTHK
ncbi:MAG: glycosyltransferase, partial [Muribaculaceae bacterium]|nr:glycosyltransferase [Muribaculaceae bacterium]